MYTWAPVRIYIPGCYKRWAVLRVSVRPSHEQSTEPALVGKPHHDLGWLAGWPWYLTKILPRQALHAGVHILSRHGSL